MRREQRGYTILEVLIFIAVSSLMFIAAIAAIGGRQKEVQFSQATKELDSKLRDIFNDVTTSYYPSNSTVQCSVFNGDVVISSSTNSSIGTNSDCVYVGKVIQFSPGDNEGIMRIYSMAGKRYSDNNLNPITSLSQAGPVAVALPTDTNFEKASEDYKMPYGLRVTRVMRQTGENVFTDYGSVAVMSSFGGTNVSDAQAVQIGGVFGTNLGMSENEVLAVVNNLTDDSINADTPGFFEKNVSEGVILCLESPDGIKESITFGVNNNTSTQISVDNYNKGCDL